MARAWRTEESHRSDPTIPSGGMARGPPSSEKTARWDSAVGLDTRNVTGDVDVLCAQSHALHIQRCAQSAGQPSFAHGAGAAAGTYASIASVLLWMMAVIILGIAFGIMLMGSTVPHGSKAIGVVMLALVLLEADPRGLHEFGSLANETSEAHVYGNALVF